MSDSVTTPTEPRTTEALRPEVAADSALHRIEQLLEPLDDSAQGQRRWADVNVALDVARACRRLLAPHVAALASQPEPAVTEALRDAAERVVKAWREAIPFSLISEEADVAAAVSALDRALAAVPAPSPATAAEPLRTKCPLCGGPHLAATSHSYAELREYEKRVEERKRAAARVEACRAHDRNGPTDEASGFPTCSECGAILTAAPAAEPSTEGYQLPTTPTGLWLSNLAPELWKQAPRGELMEPMQIPIRRAILAIEAEAASRPEPAVTEALRKAVEHLLAVGSHADWCFLQPDKGECDCGLWQAQAKTRAALAAVPAPSPAPAAEPHLHDDEAGTCLICRFAGTRE